MNAVEIEEAISALAERPFDAEEFPYAFLEAFGNKETTLKRLRKKGASIALEPANAAYETRIFGPDRVKIQGRLAGLYRRYN